MSMRRWHAITTSTLIRPSGKSVCLRRCGDQLAPEERFTPQPQQDGGNRNWNQAVNRQIQSVVSRRVCRFQRSVDKLCIQGVTFRRQLIFDHLNDHVSRVIRACNFHIWTLHHIRSLYTKDISNIIAISIVGIRWDYSVLYGCSQHQPSAALAEFVGSHRLSCSIQIVHNAASSLTMYTGYRSMQELYWKLQSWHIRSSNTISPPV